MVYIYSVLAGTPAIIGSLLLSKDWQLQFYFFFVVLKARVLIGFWIQLVTSWVPWVYNTDLQVCGETKNTIKYNYRRSYYELRRWKGMLFSSLVVFVCYVNKWTPLVTFPVTTARSAEVPDHLVTTATSLLWFSLMSICTWHSMYSLVMPTTQLTYSFNAYAVLHGLG